MKKEYIKPTIEIINIEMQSMLAGSSKFNFDGYSGTTSLNDDSADEDEAW